MKELKKLSASWPRTAVSDIAWSTRDPFQVLISTLISARTKDSVTNAASRRLFALAKNPRDMSLLSAAQIEQAIYPAAFYRNKARQISALCRTLLDKFAEKVPDHMEGLLELQGVGRKTANLVLNLGFRKHGICVDTHVHRISNRWGIIKTRTPQESEFALYKILPKRYWIDYNDKVVEFGQNLCRPISPFCSRCPLDLLCPKKGVTTRR